MRLRTTPMTAPTWPLALSLVLVWTAVTAVLLLLVQAGLLWRVLAYGLAAALALLSALNLLHVITKMAWMRRFHGAHLVERCRRSYALFLKTSRVKFERSKLRSHSTTGLAIGSLVLFFDPWVCAAIAAYLLSTSAAIASRIYLPVSVVYLAASSPLRLELLNALQHRIILNFTALLDTGNLPSGGAEGGLAGWNFSALFDSRTFNDDDWQEVVEALMDIAPTVLLDARDTSPGVLHEVDRIFARMLQDKTVFIADDDGGLPALERVGIAERAGDSLNVVTQDALLRDAFALLFREHVPGANVPPGSSPPSHGLANVRR
ncbi:hypothetical protein [Tahibacter sp.]|uniref:hypothetical protein n=1 Tax=Tahibacter sp. TaxID=2056211 RepID=UPI0028C4C159|nr:hypothetical protein [Tahibacter sp.]